MDAKEIEQGELPIRVSKEVVSHLSMGLYRNFARAAKELISNSYDADALEVKININLENKKVTIRDDGQGMDIEEIHDKFLRIGAPTLLKDQCDKLGRKRVGAFGIGFLSVFPYCESLDIITKKRGSDEIIELHIDTGQFFNKDTFLMENVKVPYKKYKYNSDLPREKGETILILNNLRPHIIKDLIKGSNGNSTIDKMDGLDKFRWTLCQYTPIQYPKENIELRDFFNQNQTPMRLWLNGEELFRNVPKNATILEKKEMNIGDIHFKYVIMTPYVPIEPRESRGLQIRLNDVGIGLPTDFDAVKIVSKNLGRLYYLCGEIQILSGLNTALKIDRDSFSFTEEISEMEDYFRSLLTHWSMKLDKWALDDKLIYNVLPEKTPESIINQLKDAQIIHLSKERLRLSSQSKASKKESKSKKSSNKIQELLSEREDYKVITNTSPVSEKDTAIKVIPEEKTIIIYDKHPDFLEELIIGKQKFNVEYGEWGNERGAYSICYINGNTVIFNSSNPIFKSTYDEKLIKKLSLRILLAVKDKADTELLAHLNKVLETTFSNLRGAILW